jgi:hypothetical protein
MLAVELLLILKVALWENQETKLRDPNSPFILFVDVLRRFAFQGWNSLVYVVWSNEAPMVGKASSLQISLRVSLNSPLSYSYVQQHMPFVRV